MITMKSTRRALAGMFAALAAAPAIDFDSALFPPLPNAAATEPEPATIPGVDQIEHVRALLTVTTEDGRIGVLHLEFSPDVPVRFRHMGGLQGEIPVPGNCLASFPNWLQREIGYAALGAASAVEEIRS